MFPLVSVPGVDHLDVSALIADPRNVLLMGDGGGLLFIWHEPGVYEVHNNWLKAYRGRPALRATLAALRWMFTCTDCMVILTRVPAFNKPAERLAAFVGGTREFARKAVWPTPDGLIDMSFWALRYDDWLRRTPDLINAGRAFHARLDEEFARHGKTPVRHPDEDCHDLCVGALGETIFGGQPEKAIVLYNRWARFAGYGLVSLVARNPVIVDIGDAVLQATGDGTFKVLKCR